MRVDLFDFELPEERIALRPVSPRDSAKMLVVDGSGLNDQTVGNLVDVLRPGDCLVFNDTKVVPTQLEGTRLRGESEATVSATLHTRLESSRWLAFVRGAKKLRAGDKLVFQGQTSDAILVCEVVSKHENGSVELLFELAGADFDEALVQIGSMPLPPYIAGKRGADVQDVRDYQTVYAAHEGAVAAPTAGLHFTDDLLKSLENKGVLLKFATLHVGPGTFLPVKVEDTEEHVMHSEWCNLSAETANELNLIKSRGGRIVSVGTTALRILESAADENGIIHPLNDNTDIFITPGYQFRAVDILMTNFHLPKSTLFMLVSAFSGLETMKKAYHHAIEHEYRFYSYGDASLLYRQT